MTNQKIDFRVNLPIRHSRQAEIANSCAKRKVVNAGRRGGKTTLAADISVSDYFLDGRTVMYAAPVGKQTDAYWNKCKHYLADGIRRDFIHKDETRRILKLGSAEISCQRLTTPTHCALVTPTYSSLTSGHIWTMTHGTRLDLLCF